MIAMKRHIMRLEDMIVARSLPSRNYEELVDLYWLLRDEFTRRGQDPLVGSLVTRAIYRSCVSVHLHPLLYSTRRMLAAAAAFYRQKFGRPHEPMSLLPQLVAYDDWLRQHAAVQLRVEWKTGDRVRIGVSYDALRDVFIGRADGIDVGPWNDPLGGIDWAVPVRETREQVAVVLAEELLDVADESGGDARDSASIHDCAGGRVEATYKYRIGSEHERRLIVPELCDDIRAIGYDVKVTEIQQRRGGRKAPKRARR
jgi:hypothetical protein